MKISEKQRKGADLTEVLLRVQLRYDHIAFRYPDSEGKEQLLRRLARREDRVLRRLQETKSNSVEQTEERAL